MKQTGASAEGEKEFRAEALLLRATLRSDVQATIPATSRERIIAKCGFKLPRMCTIYFETHKRPLHLNPRIEFHIRIVLSQDNQCAHAIVLNNTAI